MGGNEEDRLLTENLQYGSSDSVLDKCDFYSEMQIVLLRLKWSFHTFIKLYWKIFILGSSRV